MRGERHLQDVVVDYQCAGLDHEELFGGLDAVEGDGSFVAVADAGVAVVVGEVLDDELLADVDDL